MPTLPPMNNGALFRAIGMFPGNNRVRAVTPHRSYTFQVSRVRDESGTTILHLEEVEPVRTREDVLADMAALVEEMRSL